MATNSHRAERNDILRIHTVKHLCLPILQVLQVLPGEQRHKMIGMVPGLSKDVQANTSRIRWNVSIKVT